MKIGKGHIVRWEGKLWRVMDCISDVTADLWNIDEDATAPISELEYLGEDTLTTFPSGLVRSPTDSLKSVPVKKKRDSITTGGLISEEVKKLREEEKPEKAASRPARKSVLDEPTKFVPKAKAERKGSW